MKNKIPKFLPQHIRREVPAIGAMGDDRSKTKPIPPLTEWEPVPGNLDDIYNNWFFHPGLGFHRNEEELTKMYTYLHERYG